MVAGGSLRMLVIVGLGIRLAGGTPPAGAYEVLLDIDLDGDPATINELVHASSCNVSIVLAPTGPGEVVESVTFGLGGSCRECDGVHQYGVDFDFVFDTWPGNPAFAGVWDGILLLGCPDEIGYHNEYRLEPVSGSYVLDGPIFLATFPARVATPPPGCAAPPANLAAMPANGAWWNYVQIGGPAIDARATGWSAVKSTYR